MKKFLVFIVFTLIYAVYSSTENRKRLFCSSPPPPTFERHENVQEVNNKELE